ncbi:PGPGW domain-containing protein [Desulfobulbus alkaliphilus]|uniref:PGPGW domain-containing protein n=1 Tax=Desulfobulbus alkaliphilus TaxID=869814 RepID=UPI001F050C72|nr:PGPGW domain-containing protein [Desulfobulbus alkaliphilus]
MLTILGLFSLCTFIGSLIVVPVLISQLRPNYFLDHWQRVEARRQRHPALSVMILLVRNGIGLVLVAAGVAMLVLPGQGLLTILIGVCVMDFPGKRRLIDRLVCEPHIQRALNWIRRKAGKPDFVFPPK